MSSHYHAIVWIDHHEARIFQFDATDVDSTTIRSSHPHQHIHHKANSGDSGHAAVDKAFLEQVSHALQQAGVVLITGPAGAKKELASYIEHEQPSLAKRIAAVHTLDHPTDGELVKLARTFFVADDRMRSQSHS
jgi:stalled ribosome rescue protein Dom34